MEWLALACIPLGVLLVSWSFFLYEPQEQKIHQTLELWWVTVDDLEMTWTKRNIALVREVAAVTGRWIDEWFGRKITSARMLNASVCFSLSSMLLLTFGFGIYTWVYPLAFPMSPYRIVCFALAGAVIFAAATRRRQHKYFELTRGAVAVAGLAGFALFLASTSGHVSGFFAGLIAGVACHYVVIITTRCLTVWGRSTRHWVIFVLLAAFNAAVGIGLIIAPMLIMNTGRMGGILADILGFGAIANVFGGIVAASFAILATSLVFQKVTWPLVSRPIYALARFRVFQNRKLLFFAGSSLIAIGVPQLGSWRESIFSLFGR